jgi:hypothetical protein
MTNSTRRRLATLALTPCAALATWALIRLIGVDLGVSVGSHVRSSVTAVGHARGGRSRPRPALPCRFSDGPGSPTDRAPSH